MKLTLKSNLWSKIYYKMRDEFYLVYLDGPSTVSDMENFMKTHGVNIIKDIDGRWDCIEINLNNEELTVFLLKWAT
jgi:hypothetical protein